MREYTGRHRPKGLKGVLAKAAGTIEPLPAPGTLEKEPARGKHARKEERDPVKFPNRG